MSDGAVRVHDELLGRRRPHPHRPAGAGDRPTAAGRERLAAAQGLAQRGRLPAGEAPEAGPGRGGLAGHLPGRRGQGPKDVRESLAQGLAAAAKAGGAPGARTTIEKEPITAQLDLEKCIFCGRCVPVCPFGAIEMLGPDQAGAAARSSRPPARAAAPAPPSATTTRSRCPTSRRSRSWPRSMPLWPSGRSEKVLVFACNWCSYAGADQAGIEKIQYPPRPASSAAMCSARRRGGVHRPRVRQGRRRRAGHRLPPHGERLRLPLHQCQRARRVKRFEFWQPQVRAQGSGAGAAPAPVDLRFGGARVRRQDARDGRTSVNSASPRAEALERRDRRVEEVGRRPQAQRRLTLDDALWERVMAATDGAVAPCFQCGVCTATCPWGLLQEEPVNVRRADAPRPARHPAGGRRHVVVHDLPRLRGAVPARRPHRRRHAGAAQPRLEGRAACPRVSPPSCGRCTGTATPGGGRPPSATGWAKGVDVTALLEPCDVLSLRRLHPLLRLPFPEGGARPGRHLRRGRRRPSVPWASTSPAAAMPPTASASTTTCDRSSRRTPSSSRRRRAARW